MYIAFYISSHGFGHMTRCLSLIENILKTSEYNIYIVCGKKQNDFARIYLKNFENRIIYKDLITDIGLVNKIGTLEVDKEALEKCLYDFIATLDSVVIEEVKFLSNLDVKTIVTDISPIGCVVGHNLKLPTILVSNFTWVEQYEYLDIDQDLINIFRLAYSYVNIFIKYDLCLPMSSIKVEDTYEAGFVCREIDKSRVIDIRNKYKSSIFVTCGKSATLESINIRNFEGTIFTTSGIDINCENQCEIVELPIDILDTQNYIAASDIVISKAGWGTIAEGIIGHSNLVLIERPSAKEDTFNIENIKANNLGISIKECELMDIDILEIREKLDNNIDYEKLNSYKNDVEKVVSLII